jgi:hypothetical protein
MSLIFFKECSGTIICSKYNKYNGLIHLHAKTRTTHVYVVD